jgi:hypothetical protein
MILPDGKGNQWQSMAITSLPASRTRTPIHPDGNGHQWPSMAINGHQWPSMAINGERKLACFAHAYAHPRCVELRLRRQ